MKMGELRRDAIFSSGTETFVTPLEPEANGEVTLRCRTAKGDVDEVNLIHEESSSKMSKEYSDEIFDFYSIKVKLGEVPFSYYFQIKKGSTVMYFNKQGDVDVPNPQYSYCLYPGFHTPDWGKRGGYVQTTQIVSAMAIRRMMSWTMNTVISVLMYTR